MPKQPAGKQFSKIKNLYKDPSQTDKNLLKK